MTAASSASHDLPSPLHSVTSGHGPRLVMLHGWALNSHVWDDVEPALAERFTVVRVDLPGHGASPWPPAFTDLRSLAATLAPHLQTGAIVMGWSLGALAGLQLAVSHPERVRALVAIAATPKFVAATDWPHGVAPEVLAEFASHLHEDHEATVRDFLALQVRGDERAMETLRLLRRRVLALGAPHTSALSAGLEVLRTADLREELARIATPTLVVAGERDRLTLPDASRELAAQLQRARFALVQNAAHAPFISHREAFLREVGQFLGRAA